MDNQNEQRKPQREKEEARLLLTPLRLLVKLAVRLAPEKYKEKVRKNGKKMTSHGFSDAAVIITLLYDAGATLLVLVALVVLGIAFSLMEE